MSERHPQLSLATRGEDWATQGQPKGKSRGLQRTILLPNKHKCMRLLRMEAVLRMRRGCLGDTEALRRGRGRAKPEESAVLLEGGTDH